MEDAWKQLRAFDADDMDCGFVDSNGMTPLHLAARAVSAGLCHAILDRAPESLDRISLLMRTPSSWSVLNCLADTPFRPALADGHWELCRLFAENMTEETMMHVTANGTTHLHQLVSRGHNKSLEVVLQTMTKRRDLGKQKVAFLLNHRVGPQGLGCVDTALKCNKVVVPMVKFFGGEEQTEAPDDWRANRRRNQGDGTNNARSDEKRGRAS